MWHGYFLVILKGMWVKLLGSFAAVDPRYVVKSEVVVFGGRRVGVGGQTHT